MDDDPAAVLSTVIRLLLAHGQTTERVVQAAQGLAGRLGYQLGIAPGWGCTLVSLVRGEARRMEVVVAPPVAVDMRVVAGVMRLIEPPPGRPFDIATVVAGLQALDHTPPVSVARYAVMAAAGAAALAVVFGVARVWDLVVIAAVAGTGALVRRGLARRTGNLFVQPLAASLIAGLAGAIAIRAQASPQSGLLALCPCMILVPGPHLLNGAMDLVRGRVALGGTRLGYASTTILMICLGLLTGLALGGASLPQATPPSHVPILFDTLAAGVAVLAYGSFFAMPWTLLPAPVMVGMAAHALRWALVGPAHASPVLGAFAACLLVGACMAPLADRLHLPFAGCAFAAVVSLIPGVFLFEMAAKLVEIVGKGADAPTSLVAGALADGTIAGMTFLAMCAGLLIPRLLLQETPRGGPA